MMVSISGVLTALGSITAPSALAGGCSGIDDALEAVPLTDRHFHRQAMLAERILDLLDEACEIDVFRVHLVDDDDPAEADLAGFVKHAARVDLDTRVGVDHDRRGLGGVHGGDGLADEVGIARRVDDVEPLALVVEVEDVRLDRIVVLLFYRIEVADAGAVVYAGRPSDGAGDSEHLVGQGALAGVPVAAKDNVADVFDFSDRHA